MTKTIQTPFKELLVIEPRFIKDSRGYFFETYQESRYKEQGIPHFVQDNMSRSKQGTLRGLHYQLPNAQGKLVWVMRGTVWDVVVDIRLTSKTFGQWFSMTLSEKDHIQLYIPPGFAHGFCVLSDEADFHYKCTDFYNPQAEHGIAWNDQELHIEWPIKNPILSAKDGLYPPLSEIPHDELFK